MNKQFNAQGLVLTIAFVLFVSCERQVPDVVKKYGVGYDSIRSTLGLPTIQGNKIEYNRSGHDYAIYTANKYIPNPKYDYKSFFWLDSVGLYLERNYFLGPNNEELLIYYAYADKIGKESLVKGISYSIEIPNSGGKSISITKEQADSALNKWGLKIR
jgi:hypothetical protein